MTTIVLVWLLALALGAFAAREGFDLSWAWTGASGLLVSVLAVAALVYFQGARATVTAFRDKLVDDISTLWKRWSVWVLGAVVAFNGYFLTLPEKIQDEIPHQLLAGIAVVGALAAIGAMVLKQPNLPPKDGA